MQERTPVLAPIDIRSLNNGDIPRGRANEKRRPAIGAERARDGVSALRLNVTVSLHRVLPFCYSHLLDEAHE